MPCESKHIEAIRRELNACAGTLIVRHELNAAIVSALEAAGDESPCVWAETSRGFGPFNVAGCLDRAYGNDHGFTYCPHCGRKIAPMAAALGEKP